MSKSVIFLFLFIGSTVGSYLPLMWGGSLFSLTSVLLSAVGGLLGIYVGLRVSQNM